MAVLDSSVIISLISGSSSGELLRKRFGEESFSTTSISINEVFIGLTEKQRQSVSPFFHGIEILPFDSEAAFRSVDLEKSMRAKGRLIGKPDIFIAAICITHGLPLVTMDAGFKNVDGLKVMLIH